MKENLDGNLTKADLLAKLKQQEKTIYSLKHVDRKYENLFNNSIDGIYKSTPQGKFLEVNMALVKMLGYNSKEDLMEINIGLQLYNKVEDRNFANEQFQEVEKKIQQLSKKDGSKIWIEDYGKNILDASGEVLYYEGIIRNVTEIKRASDIQKVLLKISQNGYKNQDLKDYNKFIISELGNLLDVSFSFIAFYNEKKKTINIPFISGEKGVEEFPIGKSMTGYLIKKNKPILIKEHEFKGLIDSGEVELIGAFPKVWLGVPLQVDNKVIGAIVIQNYNDEDAFQQSDIELLKFVSSHISIAIQRKKNEYDATVSKEVLRKVLDNIPIKVFWKNKESVFLGSNSAFLKENSFSNEEEIIGKSDFDFNEREDAEKYRASDVAIMQNGKPKLNYQELFVVNGKEKWITTSKIPFFDDNNKVIGIIGTSEDITERVENEIKLKNATDEAIAANLSKSMFLSNMSHEIRTPMNAILGYSQLLQDDDNLSKIQRENLKTINKSGEHLLALINDILDMSKIEAGRIVLKPSHFNFIELLKEVEQLFKFKAQQKELDLSFKINDNVPKTIFADESKIKQVIINLIGNAIKFTEKGFVHISVGKLANNMIQVDVKDTGKGILKEEQELIFKPFEQAQKGGQERGGTGLGLAISKKFSNLMEGDITIESEYEKGSVFSFKFNYIEGDEDVLKEEKQLLKVISLTPEMQGMKVAIVDDRFENRDILFKKLDPLGFDTRMAENGQEAVELYKQWKPDIILMDVVMPIMNGVEATRQILELSGTHDVKIFVVSASALESEQKEVMEIGATVFIKKPVIFNFLLSEMHEKAGVKFIYKDEVKEETEVVIATPADVPENIKEKLVNAASEGDFMLLEELLGLLEKETNMAFKYIEECINEMEFENLTKWLKS
jgi:PAS domain S-box-containing protein